MKKLLLAILFLGGMTAQANTVTNLDHKTEKGIRYNQAQSVTFIERGVEFVIFTNGQFDFARTGQQYQQRNQGRRGTVRNAPGRTYGVSYTNNYRGFVKQNRYGDIYKVGRNYVDYNRNGDVSQIGSVSLRYKKGLLVRVGDMNIIYNRRGQIVDLRGYVHHDHATCGVCGMSGCSTNHFDYNNVNHNDWDYRKKGKNWYGKIRSSKEQKYKSRKEYKDHNDLDYD